LGEEGVYDIAASDRAEYCDARTVFSYEERLYAFAVSEVYIITRWLKTVKYCTVSPYSKGPTSVFTVKLCNLKRILPSGFRRGCLQQVSPASFVKNTLLVHFRLPLNMALKIYKI
jgi:hypothetical protein